MSTYLLVSAVTFAILFVIWSKTDAKNLLIKAALLLLSVWGAFWYLVSAGYIVKP